MIKRLFSSRLRPGAIAAESDASRLDSALPPHSHAGPRQDKGSDIILEPGPQHGANGARRHNHLFGISSGEQLAAVAPTATSCAPRVSVSEEMPEARRIHDLAHRTVRDVMRAVRQGKPVDIAQIVPLVDRITASVDRNSGALLGLLSIKSQDDYTILHALAVCTLMLSFGRSMGLDADTLREVGMGGLLHDVGKMKLPDRILNKRGRLTDEEYGQMERHAEYGHEALKHIVGIGPLQLDIARHHHERMDGSGYPDRLAGKAISPYARMAAIVDVYDALTSDRRYRKAVAPTEALRKMWEWTNVYFDPDLMRAFIRCVGIYPVGSLVLLESGRLGVVTEQTTGDLLSPKVRVFFHTKSDSYLTPEVVDLSRQASVDQIASHELPEKWLLDPTLFLVSA